MGSIGKIENGKKENAGKNHSENNQYLEFRGKEKKGKQWIKVKEETIILLAPKASLSLYLFDCYSTNSPCFIVED